LAQPQWSIAFRFVTLQWSMINGIESVVANFFQLFIPTYLFGSKGRLKLVLLLHVVISS